MDKSKLGNLLQKHKAQPVGDGYIDIIVSRYNYKYFISDLVMNGYKIQSISWWEWCPEGEQSNYGLGRPKSNYCNGWSSELAVELDDLTYDKPHEEEEVIKYVTDKIETKIIVYPGETIMFKSNSWLTPAIWLNVPED